MSSELLMIFACVTAILAVLGLYSFFADMFMRDKSRVNKRLAEEFRQRPAEAVARASLFKDLHAMAKDAEEPSADLRQRFTTMVGQSGLKITPARLLTIMVAAGLVLGGLTWLLQGSVLIAAVVWFVGTAGPMIYVHAKYKARRAKLLSQLPDAFDLMARVIRAGQTVPNSMLAVADEFEDPIGAEFGLCYEQMNLGLPSDVALRVLAQRTALLEIQIFVLAVIVQLQTGGNLAELLDKLAQVVRERFKVQAKVHALTAEGRVSAIVLLLLPVCLFLGLQVVNPGYISTLYQYPWLLATTVAAEALGALWIYKIVHFDF